MTPKLLVRDVSEYADLPDGLEKIEDVYIFDDDKRVHCASLTSSIKCEHLYVVLHFTDYVDDAAREEFYEQYSYVDQDIIYCSPGDSGIVDLDDKYDDDDEEPWEDVVDYYRCNHAY